MTPSEQARLDRIAAAPTEAAWARALVADARAAKRRGDPHYRGFARAAIAAHRRAQRMARG